DEGAGALRRQEGRPRPLRRQYRAVGAGRDHRARHGQVGPPRPPARRRPRRPRRARRRRRAARPPRRQHRRGPAPARLHLALGRARPDRGRRADARRRSRRGDSRGDARRGLRRRARRLIELATDEHPMRRRQLLLAPASLLLARDPLMPATRSPDASFAHEGGSAVALALAMAEGRATSERIVRDCLARIEAIDRHGPRLHSVIELNSEALAIAKALDGERKAGRLRGPLHGVPVLVKDNIATGDRMSTSVGSLAFDGVRAPRDANIVKRLRDAGAVILGKNNLSEWANIRSTRSVSGWSARGGLTRNPYALDRSTSGSSSGTAAAIAASLAPLGVGTETDGSIVSPSSICGLVGLKPTVGRLSRDGIVPISPSQDTPGPMTRSVADAALLYAAMAGRDGADAATSAAPDERVAAPIALPDDALRGARIGVARAYFTGFDELDALIDQAI